MSRAVLRVRSFTVPKAGNEPEANDDSLAGPYRAADGFRLAVADGATESAYSGRWAYFLAREMVGSPPDEAIAHARLKFHGTLDVEIDELPWYAQAKIEQGAHAALLAVEIRDEGTWSAYAVGDCVLFVVREGEVMRTWPITDPESFDNRPSLIGSQGPAPLIEETGGEWRPSDLFVAATDAVAAYLMRHPDELLDLMNADGEALVARARKRGMRNDDVTYIAVTISSQ